MKKHFLTPKQKGQATILLYQHCHPQADGSALYEPGWSDERIAQELKIDFHVFKLPLANLRRQNIGNTTLRGPKKKNGAEGSGAEGRLATLEKSLNEVIEYLTRGNNVQGAKPPLKIGGRENG